MQVLHSLHVSPYPDPYPSLTESPISPPTSQPPARSLTCMRPGFCLPPLPADARLRPVRHGPLFPCFLSLSLVSAAVVSRIRFGGGGRLCVEGWSLTLKKSRCQRRTTCVPISPTKLASPRTASALFI